MCTLSLIQSATPPLTVITKIPYGKKKPQRFSLLAANWKNALRPIVVLVPGRWQQVGEVNSYFTVARALVEDGMTVAVVEYSSLNSLWPQQFTDVQHALSVIMREAVSVGGDPGSVILCGDGLGSYIVMQMVLSLSKDAWRLPGRCSVAGWMTIDAVWAEDSIMHLPARHPLRVLFPDQKSWSEQKYSPMRDTSTIPGFAVQLGHMVAPGQSSGAPAVSLAAAEAFASRAVRFGGDITFLTRPEESKRIWKNIAKPDHPLRISWRPWLQRITQSRQ